MDVNKSFFIKQTTNLSRTRIDNIRYKVDVNTMEKLSLENGRLTKETLPMQLNQIARVVLTTAKELFFDPYQANKATGSFILIDPITNNTSAVGMIIDRVERNDKIGVCLDTCHVFDAGYDIVNNLDGVLEEFDRVIGLERLKAIHLNDSMNPIGNHKDRHQKIGEGYILSLIHI